MKIEDLPTFIRIHASYMRDGIKIDLYYIDLMSEEELKELPKSKKWIKSHGGWYEDRGYWFIPNENYHPLSDFERIFVGGKLQYVLKDKK